MTQFCPFVLTLSSSHQHAFIFSEESHLHFIFSFSEKATRVSVRTCPEGEPLSFKHSWVQIKTTTRYHLTLIRMAIIEKSTSNKCWRGWRQKGTLLHWWECKLTQPLWKTVWRRLKNLNIGLPCDQAILLLGIYPEKTRIETDTHTSVSIAVLFTIARIRKQPKSPSAKEWIKKI